MRLFVLVLLVLFPLSGFSVDLVKWESSEGVERLMRAEKVDFFPLANHFESQENKLFCGMASSAMVLNALRLDQSSMTKPQDNRFMSKAERKYLPKGFDPIFERYTQRNVLNSKTKSLDYIFGKPVKINGKMIADYGLQLRQLAEVLSSNGLEVKLRVADSEVSDDTIRKELIDNMKTKGDYVLVNYSRGSLGQEGTGHISPLGAYDKVSDSFLILDVNPNAAGWVWVKANDLISAMRTKDIIENRGYILVAERGSQPK